MKSKTITENGFKESKVGLIPDDWNVTRITDITETKAGGTPSTFKREYWDGDIPWINSGALKDVVVREPSKYITKIGLENSVAKILPEKTVLIALTGATTGKVGFLDFKCSTNQSVVGILPNSDFISKYLFYYLIFSRDRILNLKSGAAQPHINKAVVDNFLVSLPEKPEQQKITFVLSKIQQAIKQQDKIIQITKELKKSLMNKLFTEGLHGEEQKETEIGLMPKSWQVRTVKNTCEKPQYGYTESASDKPIGPKFLRITDITDKGVDWLKVPYCKCPQELINKYKLEKGDILFARIGATTGKSFIVEKCPFAIYASYLIRLRTKTELNSMYLYYFFNSEMYWKQIDAHKGSSLKKGVNGSILASLIFPFPKKQEQEEIANILLSIDKKISQAEFKKQTLQALFRTMLNQLMTGKVRVKDFYFEVN